MSSPGSRLVPTLAFAATLMLVRGGGTSPVSARSLALEAASGRSSIAAGAGALQAAAPPSQDQIDKQFIAAWIQQPRLNPGAPPSHSSVVVVKFNDWMCPGCKAASEWLKPIIDKYQAMPGALTYVEKDWPWNSACNANVPQTFKGHEASCDAAEAVHLATDRGKRELMAGWLFANQEGMTPDKVRAKAAELLGVKDIAAALALKLPAVRQDVAEGKAVEIRATPTYFVNGIRAADEQGRTIPPHYFDLAIQYELSKNTKSTAAKAPTKTPTKKS